MSRFESKKDRKKCGCNKHHWRQRIFYPFIWYSKCLDKPRPELYIC